MKRHPPLLYHGVRATKVSVLPDSANAFGIFAREGFVFNFANAFGVLAREGFIFNFANAFGVLAREGFVFNFV